MTKMARLEPIIRQNDADFYRVELLAAQRQITDLRAKLKESVGDECPIGIGSALFMRTKQVIVVRTDLNMGAGKIAAQVAHAAMLFLIDKIRDGREFTEAEKHWLNDETEHVDGWKYGGIRKIVLAVSDNNDLEILKQQGIKLGLQTHEVIDLTPLTRTCIAFGPDNENKFEFTSELELLR